MNHVRLACLAALTFAATAAWATPGTMVHQGRVLDGMGTPQSGAHTLRIAVYDQAVGGSELWFEEHTVTLQDGYYGVLLGSGTPLTGTVFDGTTRYLQVQVDSDPPLGARTPVVSVPYAVRAQAADTASAVSGGLVNGSSVQVGGSTVIDASGNLDVNTADVGSLVVGGNTVVDGAGNLAANTATVSSVVVGGSTIIDSSGNIDANITDVTELRVNGATVIDSSGQYVGASDTLADLTCSIHQFARFDGTNWVCTSGITAAAVGDDRNLTVTAPDGNEATLAAYGSAAQGTGRLYVGQSTSFGGGLIYDGDGTPDVVGDTDHVTMYRRSEGVDHAVLDFPHGSGEVRLFEGLTVDGNAIVQGTTTLNDTVTVQADEFTVGDGVSGSDNRLRVLADQTHTAVIEAYSFGGSQGGGRIYAGQSATHGGGFSYDGDGTPDIVGGTDRITHFRRTDDGEHEVFSYPHNNNNVDFTGYVTRKAPLSVYTGATGQDATVIDVDWSTGVATSSPHVSRVSGDNARFSLNTPGWYRVHVRFLLRNCDDASSMYRVYLNKNGSNVDHGVRFDADQAAGDEYYSVDNTFTVLSDGDDQVGVRIQSGSDTSWGVYTGSTQYDDLTIEYLGD